MRCCHIVKLLIKTLHEVNRLLRWSLKIWTTHMDWCSSQYCCANPWFHDFLASSQYPWWFQSWVCFGMWCIETELINCCWPGIGFNRTKPCNFLKLEHWSKHNQCSNVRMIIWSCLFNFDLTTCLLHHLLRNQINNSEQIYPRGVQNTRPCRLKLSKPQKYTWREIFTNIYNTLQFYLLQNLIVF